MSAKDPHLSLSRRQRQIMDALYKLGDADVNAVMQELPDPPGYSAVRAMLTRLEEAGHVGHRQAGAKYVYFSNVARESATLAALKRVVSTFFAGSKMDAAMAFFDNQADGLSDEELGELERLIRETRRKRKLEQEEASDKASNRIVRAGKIRVHKPRSKE